MLKKAHGRIANQREALVSKLSKLLQQETGVQTKETLAYYLQMILRKNTLGELNVPTHIIDWLIMVAYMPKPEIYILQLLVDVLEEPHHYKIN